LASDVELNPGPVDFETILDAIKQSENKVLTQIRSVKTDISDIKNDISSIRNDHIKLRSEVKDIGIKQASYEEALKSTSQKVDVLNEITENLRLHTDHLNNIVGRYNDTVSTLNEEVEQLNIKSISNNMRVFGLSVGNDSTYPDLVKLVIDKVLNIACPTFKWKPDDIKNIRIIPGSDTSISSLIIITFRHDDDKYQVFKGCDLLRKYSIRVGDDLTYKQRQMLKKLKTNEGKSGYFFRGKLCVREDNHNTEDKINRVYRQAHRAVKPTVYPASYGQEMEHQ
jgi:hypothetical protein